MKKLFTLIALVASVCLSMNLSSCGDDEVAPNVPATIKYSTSWSAGTTVATVGTSETKAKEAMADFLNQKLGNIGEVKASTAGVSVYVSTNAVDKAKEIFKSINSNTKELDDKMNQIEGLIKVSFKVYDQDNKTILFDYAYSPGSTSPAAGTYSYTETFEGASYEWTATITNTPDEKQKTLMLGSIVLPRDVEGLSAGTYDGLCQITTNSVVLKSTQKNGSSSSVLTFTLDLKSVTEDGKYTASVYNSEHDAILNKVLFSKK